MLFNIDKNKGLMILKAVMALFFVLTPTVTGIIPMRVAVYAVFAIFASLLLIRIKSTGKVHFSIYHALMLGLLIYSLIASFWAGNREGHLIYIFALATVVLLFECTFDYFSVDSIESIRRRMMYMLNISGTLCAVLNIFYWIVCMVPFAQKSGFSQGFGNNHYLAIFMSVCIALTLVLYKDSIKSRRRIFVLQIICMLFVFVMAKSFIALMFALILAVLYICFMKLNKRFVMFSLLCAGVFAVIVGLFSFSGHRADAFCDVFSYASKHLFGAGGGFRSGKAIFDIRSYGKDISVGLLGHMFASSGIIGAIFCVAVSARVVMNFCRVKTWESLAGILLTVLVMILPSDLNFAMILMWALLCAYNEYSAGLYLKRNLKNESVVKTLYALSILVVIAVMLVVQSLMRVSAAVKFESKDYFSAAVLYKTSAAINFADSESCRMAATSLRMGKDAESWRDEAISLIDRAIKRDVYNLDNLVEKARMYYASGDYELSAQQYRIATGMAAVKDKYNLSLAKVLYKIVEKSPRGSSETKRAYEELTEIGAQTENLDTRKEINDIADKALVFTKGELTDER